jgi:hypothetical protein
VGAETQDAKTQHHRPLERTVQWKTMKIVQP